jgi:acetyl esterase/lipase
MGARCYSHRYGPHPEQVADLYPGDAVVVLVHGGFWRERWRRDLMAPLAEDLVARGLGAYNVEYRRLDCGGGLPETVEDVRAAIQHLRAEGHEPAAVVGHSAGGHLALLSGARAIVGQAAVTDLRTGIRLNLGEGVVERFAGRDPPPEFDPVRLAPLDADVLLVHGEDDEDVPASMSRGFPGAEVRIRPGEGHYEHIDPASGAWREVARWVAARAGRGGGRS